MATDTRYELIDKNGNRVAETYASAADAATWAARYWPDQPQDTSGDFEEPNGWDIQIAGPSIGPA